ncbi:uncharacterized protein PV09_06567 [Verruconis gallopava]|uniref:NADP-dependent oxidoreductase domain-containing protein n=1 Tax=Verruconis gallopava TaxID=253628 RepID=A0A0D1YMV2_9PEZI|nr:uncharacterized protein PV09_06567 [Verruconis gallopava]KIW02072.1 hypothetical protein PV09_06567 [Verruconis gallopava]
MAVAMNRKLQMEYQNLGNSGLKVSKIILGAMSYGSSDWQEWVLNEDDALPLLKHAYDLGINTWDTANVYSNGRSEEIIGKAIKHYNIPRSSLVILTKCYFGVTLVEGAQPSIAEVSKNDGLWVNRQGLSRKNIFDSVENSVKRLGTYIDVLQIHRLDRETPKEEIMRALNDVVNTGMVRYIGASSMAAWEFQSLQNIAEKNGWHKFISMQNFHNLLYREEEREMIPYCKATGVGIIPWSPIARGVLARPFRSRNTLRENSDNFLKTMVRGRETEIDEKIVNRVEEIAKRKGESMAKIATAYSLSKGFCPILGMNSKQRIDEACESLKVKLTPEEIKYLEEPYLPKPIAGH